MANRHVSKSKTRTMELDRMDEYSRRRWDSLPSIYLLTTINLLSILYLVISFLLLASALLTLLEYLPVPFFSTSINITFLFPSQSRRLLPTLSSIALSSLLTIAKSLSLPFFLRPTRLF